MKQRQQLKLKNVMIGIIVLGLVTTVLTFETGRALTPVERSASYILFPIQKGVYSVGSAIGKQWEALKQLHTLEGDNAKLKKEVNQLTYKNRLLQQEKKELERLRQLYQLDQRYADYPKTGARVIGKDPGNWYNIFIIDKGSNNGLEIDMAVLAGNGLVGKVIDVWPNYAKVMAIIDDRSGVSAKILRTSDLCTVSGNKEMADNGNVLLEHVAQDVQLMIGDEIITSHLGKAYPPDIMIGTVTEIINDPNHLTKKAVITPVADFKHLEEVLVVVGKGKSHD